MARMIPKKPHPDTKSQAELKLFAEFEKQLPDDYTVFHSVSWQLKTHQRGLEDGESDFLIAHPKFGLLIVEVKGGHIRYDGFTDQWSSNNNPIKDPFKQGRKNKYSLLEKLRELPVWRNRWLTVGYAAAFPDVPVKGDLRLDAPRELILDTVDLRDLRDWVERALTYLQGRRPDDSPLGPQGLESLIDTLSPSIDLPLLLATEIESDKQEQERLTRDQFRILDFLSRHRRVMIAGCAGSGKTMLAYEKAQRLATQDFKVMLTCFNVALAEWLNWESEEVRPPTLTITNFHKLATNLAHQANLALDQSSPLYFDQILPEKLLEAVDRLGTQYDAIIVDEGQDFKDSWWLPLQCLLHDPDNGIFYVFFDDNQNLYRGQMQRLPLDSAPFTLSENCRNTQTIHRQVVQFYRPKGLSTAIGPPGRVIDRYAYTNPPQLKSILRKTLHHLIVQEGVPAWDIVILTPKGRERSQLWQLGQLGNFQLVDFPSDAGGDLYCTTIYNFKGLESSIVILAEIDNDESPDQIEAILYVGCSRARSHLILLTAADLKDELSSRLPDMTVND